MPSQVSLTLSAVTSKLNNLTLYEPIDVEVLDKLLNSDLLKDSFNDPTAKLLYSDERQQLEAYRKLIRCGRAEVTYKMTDGMTFGRCDPIKSLGLFKIRREIRHTLAKGRFTDIDIENCHPAILVQVCKQNDIDCDVLEDYVNNRSIYLEEVIQEYSVNRDAAKKLFISLLYFGGFDNWARSVGTDKPATQRIKNFKIQLQQIGTVITAANKTIAKQIEKKKHKQGDEDYNLMSSVVSYYLQEIERRILETVYNFCKRKHLIPDNTAVLCADGLMILTEHYNQGLLTDLSTLINKEFGLDLKFTTKELDQDYLAILDDHILTEERIVERTLRGYDVKYKPDTTQDFCLKTLNTLFFEDLEQIGSSNYVDYFHWTKSFKYFNAHHAQFYLSNVIYKLHRQEIHAYANFDKTFNHLFFHDDKKKTEYKFTTLYDKSKYKRCYSTFYFKPNSKQDDDKYNLFNGFKYESEDLTYDMEVVKPFIDHIRYICKEEGETNTPVSDYVLNWFAHIVQKPEIKAKVAIVIYSIVEGVGKNIISDIFAEIVKGYSAKFTNTDALTNKFNAEMMGKLFVVGDELKARCQDICDELKDVITRTHENIEPKGKDRILLEDFKRYFFTTNNENVFKITNTDRRFLMIEAPDEKKSLEYYKVLVDFKEDAVKMKQLFNYFMTKDLTAYDPTVIVKTQYKARMIMANMPAYIRFIKDNFEYYQTPRYETNGEGRFIKDSAGNKISKHWRVPELYADSIEYAKRQKLHSLYTEHTFSIQFKKVFGDYQRLNAQRQSVYVFENVDEASFNATIADKYVKNL